MYLLLVIVPVQSEDLIVELHMRVGQVTTVLRVQYFHGFLSLLIPYIQQYHE
jgi:hypothetical protein